MECELKWWYLRSKLSSTLEEAEADPSSPSQILSRFRSIEKRINSSSSIPAEQLYDLIDALSECRIFAHERRKEASKKVSYFLRLLLFKQNMRRRLDVIEKNLQYTDDVVSTIPSGGLVIHHTSPDIPDPSKIIGFESHVKEIEDLLLPDNLAVASAIHEEEDAGKGVTAIGILGRCGCGKTALAQKVFDSPIIKKEFSPRIWVCLSDVLFDNHHRVKVLNYILGELGENVSESEYRMFQLLEKLQCRLMGKKFLIVLDDAWRMDEFYADLGCSISSTGESFASGLPKGSGGAVIVTGRGDNVIRRMTGDKQVIMPRLSDEICWDIFCHAVRQQREIEPYDLANMKSAFVRICDGLPLAAKTLANVIPDLQLKSPAPLSPLFLSRSTSLNV